MKSRDLLAVSACVGLTLTALANTSEAQPQQYQCHPDVRVRFEDGTCKPAPTAPNIPPNIRAAMYAACERNGGHDEYTSQCCDHLTQQLADRLRVCPPRGEEWWRNVPWADVIRAIGRMF